MVVVAVISADACEMSAPLREDCKRDSKRSPEPTGRPTITISSSNLSLLSPVQHYETDMTLRRVK